MKRYKLLLPLFLSIAMFSQEQSNDMEEAIPSKLEQLIIAVSYTHLRAHET